jgi:hypothetical protein
MYLMGDLREEMAKGCMDYVEDFVVNMKHIKEPFWVVYFADVDRARPNTLNQTVKAYHQKPPSGILGILCWYVDNSKGIFRLETDMSCPFDIPLDPSMLSDRKEDQFASVMEKGSKIEVLVS